MLPEGRFSVLAVPTIAGGGTARREAGVSDRCWAVRAAPPAALPSCSAGLFLLG